VGPGTPPRTRLEGIDALRGLVIVLMVVDHAREYSAGTGGVSDPMALDRVTPLLFWMRWAAHFCAPVFTLLAGVSAGLQGDPPAAPGGARPWSWHHVVRGGVLVLLEFTVIHLSWTFSLVWPMWYAQVIWGIGCSLIVLGVLQRVPVPVRVMLGVLCVAGHNLLDGWHPTAPPVLHWLWAILHDRQVMPLWGDLVVRTSYPILPMIGLVLAGDGVGRWMATATPAARRHGLRVGGAALVVLFLLLRLTNVYGDPHPAAYTGALPHDLLALLNVTKYPMSLAFVAMTLGPALLLLAAWGECVPRLARPLVTLGSVPMFLYVTHLYLLHALAMGWALARGIPWAQFDFRATITGIPRTFGFPLWQTLPFALAVVALLYPAARWYAALRRSRRYRFTRYF
jgi:uncharacterized membrane protein